jgi:prepilin-type N-terminal cleavage/methylation domain-containing protein
MKKIKAFTLIELLIGMIISALVISFAYTAYILMHRQFLKYKDNRKQITDTMTLNTILNNDFSGSQWVYYQEESLVFSTPGNTLEYIFGDSMMVRIAGEVSDTFHLSPQNVLINHIAEPNDNSSLRLVNELSFTANVLGETEPFHFTKNYSAEAVIKSNILKQE